MVGKIGLEPTKRNAPILQTGATHHRCRFPIKWREIEESNFYKQIMELNIRFELITFVI